MNYANNTNGCVAVYEGKRGPRKTKPHPERVFPPSEATRAAREAAAELDPDGKRTERLIDVPLKGARRSRVRIGSAWDPILTERQRNVLKGKVRLSPSMGRLWAMARGADRKKTLQEFVEALSVEELVRGRLKDRNGTFTGAPPAWVPAEFHRACVRELMKRGKYLWQDNYLEAVQAMTEIATGRGKAGAVATPGERLKAAQFVIERIEGKVPDIVNIVSDKRWAVVLDGIVAEVDEQAIDRGRKALEAGSGEEVLEADVVDIAYEEEDEPAPPTPAPVRSRRANTSRARRN
jgi:hypothetical protein